MDALQNKKLKLKLTAILIVLLFRYCTKYMMAGIKENFKPQKLTITQTILQFNILLCNSISSEIYTCTKSMPDPFLNTLVNVSILELRNVNLYISCDWLHSSITYSL